MEIFDGQVQFAAQLVDVVVSTTGDMLRMRRKVTVDVLDTVTHVSDEVG